MLFRMLLGRIALSLITLLLVSVILFFAVEFIPGDAATRFLGRDATAETLEVLRTRLNLNAPAFERYWIWLVNAISGDFGVSLTSGRPIGEILPSKILNTAILAAVAFLLHIPLTVIPAAVSATYRDRPIDHIITTLNLVAASIPTFLMATFVMIVFVIFIPLMPAVSLIDENTTFSGYLAALTLPGMSLAIVMAAYSTRMLRDNLLEVLDSNYVLMAELKGLSRWRVLTRHALPNALGPTLNITALNLAFLVSGVVMVEKVFAFPGFGSVLVDSMLLEDTPLVLATVLIASLVYIVSNLFADLVTLLLNPRLREAKS